MRRVPAEVATEDVVYMLDGLGIDTGIDLRRLCETSRFIAAALGRRPGSKVAAALHSMPHVEAGPSR